MLLSRACDSYYNQPLIQKDQCH